MADSTPEQAGWGDVWNTITQAIKHAEGTVDHALQGHHVDSLFKNSDIYGPSLRAALPRHTTMGPQPSADYGLTGLPGPKAKGSIPGAAGLLGDAASMIPGGPGPEFEAPRIIASTEDWLKHVANLKKQLGTRDLLPGSTGSMQAIINHISNTRDPGTNVGGMNAFLSQAMRLVNQTKAHMENVLRTTPNRARILIEDLETALPVIAKTKKSLPKVTTATGAFKLLQKAGSDLDPVLHAQIMAKNALLGSVGKDAAKQGAANLDFALDERARAKAALTKATDASELVPFIESTRRAPYPGGQENILDPELHEALLKKFDLLSEVGEHQGKAFAKNLDSALLTRARALEHLRKPASTPDQWRTVSGNLKHLDPDVYNAWRQHEAMGHSNNNFLTPGEFSRSRNPFEAFSTTEWPPYSEEAGIGMPKDVWHHGLEERTQMDLMRLLQQISAKQGLKDLPGGGL